MSDSEMQAYERAQLESLHMRIIQINVQLRENSPHSAILERELECLLSSYKLRKDKLEMLEAQHGQADMDATPSHQHATPK